MKTKKHAKRFWIFLAVAVPALTILTALGGAKLILSGALAERRADLVVEIGISLVALVLSMFGAYRASRKKFVWGMLFAGGYAGILLLSNLLFFGEGYGAILPNMIAILTGGFFGSLLGGGKRRKNA